MNNQPTTGIRAMASTKSELAVPFISFSSDKGFELNPEAQAFLREIPEDKKVGVISIVGKYRTGKSFFVNRVLLNTKKSGFQVGPTINPCTKGLWIWKKTLKTTGPDSENMQTILIDTEGFGGMDQNSNHDSRIFLFSLLLSSYFIYNSVGTIDENALNTLNLIINFAKDIESKSGGKADEAIFPSFLWVVRDFTLKMVDKQTGKDLTSKEYLQSALELVPPKNEAAENKNKIRRLFKQFFVDRDCVTMVRPVEDQRMLKMLDQLDNKEIRPIFVNQMLAVREMIFSRIKPKTIKGKALNGSMLVELIKGYIEIINKGNLPTVENAWVYVCRNEGIKASQDALRELQGKLQQILKSGPIDPEEMSKLEAKLSAEALQAFRYKSMGSQESNPDILDTMNRRVNNLLKDFVERNKYNMSEKYKDLSQQVVDQLKDRLFKDDYKSYADFLEDFNKAKDQYEKMAGQSTEKWTAFNQMTESIHRLAGETITSKINNSLQAEKQLLEERVNQREQELKAKRQEFLEEREALRQRVEELERGQARMAGAESANSKRLQQMRDQRQRLLQRCNKLEISNQERQMELERLKNETAKFSQIELEEAKTQIKILKSNMEKERMLNEMDKGYHEKEVASYKEKLSLLENENRRLKSSQQEMFEELQRTKQLLEEKQQAQSEFGETREAFQRKIQALQTENNRKAELLSEHSQWVLEKSYLENQVTFLKNTLNQHKRLHDALLVALQQSVNSTEVDNSSELVQTNKNLSSAMEKLEARCRLLEEKSEKLKRFKKIVKNCTALQCLHCSKWIANTSFPMHLSSCSQSTLGRPADNLVTRNNFPLDTSSLHITISQTLIKQLEQNKPFTEYYIQLSLHNKKWTVTRKYKNFCELQQALLQAFPTMRFPESSNAIINIHTDINQVINSKRTVAVEERRKALQQFMRDLSKIDQVRNSKPFRDFIKLDENLQILDNGNDDEEVGMAELRRPSSGMGDSQMFLTSTKKQARMSKQKLKF